MSPDRMTTLEHFCEKYIKSFVCWDLVIFFYDNDDGIAADGDLLANSIGRNSDEVERYMKELVDSGLIIVSDENYRLCTDQELRREVEQFVRAVDDRSQRLALLTTLLKKGIR